LVDKRGGSERKNKGILNGHPAEIKATVHDYPNRIDHICIYENMTWNEVATNITSLIHIYDIGGAKDVPSPIP